MCGFKIFERVWRGIGRQIEIFLLLCRCRIADDAELKLGGDALMPFCSLVVCWMLPTKHRLSNLAHDDSVDDDNVLMLNSAAENRRGYWKSHFPLNKIIGYHSHFILI
ncbi:hypothetical protein CHUAL_001758 [Chamberlinius hualienensis]